MPSSNSVEVIRPFSGAVSGTTARSFTASEIRIARDLLRGHNVWHINSTAVGGGVAELLSSAIAYHFAAGISAVWLVPAADQAFFGITKQLHHLLHGSAGTGKVLGNAERALYAKVTQVQAEAVLGIASAGDVVVLHDPQPLGMAPALAAAGLHVIWRSHIGTTQWSPQVRAGWDFLEPFLAAPRRYVYSSPRYVPTFLDHRRTEIIHPSIDPSSVKCQPMSRSEVRGVLMAIGLSRSRRQDARTYALRPALQDHARVLHDQFLPVGAQAVIQVSRWDPLKDMPGVLQAFAEHIAPFSPAHLVLAGPDPGDIPDDPENAHILERVLRRYEHLPLDVRSRVHLIILRLKDLQANAVIVNALQRRATVIAQKSLQEGFGLAVTEAMWKRRVVVASAVGGITEQILHGHHGLLINDPADLAAFGRSVLTLLGDAPLRAELARAAYNRCRVEFLAERELTDYARLYVSLIG